jgi:AraC-like DNA-binding protein
MVRERSDERTAEASADVAGSDVIRAMGDIPAIVIKLLSQAGRFIDDDRLAAKACIDRASALLERATWSDGGVGRCADATKFPALTPWQTRRVAEYVAKNLDSRIRNPDLAAVAGLSPSYFSRAFRGSFGMTGPAYVIKKRMQLAQELMLTTDEPLSQIALACGLSDQAQLCKMFHRELGLRPAAWRRDRRGISGRTVARSLPLA